jgi:hypothetical protein
MAIGFELNATPLHGYCKKGRLILEAVRRIVPLYMTLLSTNMAPVEEGCDIQPEGGRLDNQVRPSTG